MMWASYSGITALLVGSILGKESDPNDWIIILRTTAPGC